MRNLQGIKEKASEFKYELIERIHQERNKLGAFLKEPRLMAVFLQALSTPIRYRLISFLRVRVGSSATETTPKKSQESKPKKHSRTSQEKNLEIAVLLGEVFAMQQIGGGGYSTQKPTSIRLNPSRVPGGRNQPGW